ncbi:potassium channel family protein [Actinomadura xylanilytica]|uniref:potassium channel family protein n=1 Tax=Actinomadura xylanilytica TaxID=887459 RepID=UPI00255A99FB|nr:potassium channel family protein [Actinomadura xylanilytica]MDL4772749.1 potassium channel family protein [Actinomadura xylanilytica]
MVVVGIYFVVPLRAGEISDERAVLRLALLALGLVIMLLLVTRQVRRAVERDRSMAEQVALLLTLVTVVVAFFAAAYYLLDEEFNGIRTRLDALYFSVTTLGTVGYGDITARGQIARAVTMVQIVFDLVIVTSAISIIVGAFRRPGDSGGQR